MSDWNDVERLVAAAFADRARLSDPQTKAAVVKALHGLDRGELRVAEKKDGEWKVNAWLMQAVNLFFAISPMETTTHGAFEARDKIPLKKDLEKAGIRVVPGGVARFGSHLEPGAVLMPGFVNIGARVGANSMVDTWATVGSCAQVGANVHLAGGVGIGGVLEPPGARPNIIEDGCFIGSRCIIVEGALIEEDVVLGANVVITASTPIIDVTGPQEVVYKGRVPARSVVIPGTRPKQYPAGTFQIPCALIVGKRSASTDKKVSLNQALRDFEVQV
ncbi:2,3,4,5-tetrahydropyridine-2,6-dicarboxylate N-succinyltransferase [Anaeromyxobacter oryzae]|uniref:2,3,4,5-tetrahydropyridine-2,6-dicarboxylate N-succinyltransferase n=1 Tax=Anaeromyxobacter oryzae TaxID=2918170 RepID=A0ABM7WTG1_9BACT|nr:2,3,4,5-tetrahydropyridine-2,6-dicarboxylate N-succinyltransferase [Anaeromyxobacter oryzae]BDG02772.1 2,3,4,5-tetrahydropyridine-2,6-dicarboxylate N-succinyltransferase [Anaeromyxobacter oryzae]